MDEKLERIISGSRQLFRKHGLRNLSMDDIARELGMSKKTIYQYVANKTELIEKVLNNITSGEELACVAPQNGSLNAIDVLLEVSRTLSRELQNLNPVNVFELQKFYPALYNAFITARREHILTQIVRNIRQGQAENLFRNELDANVIARMYVQQLMDVHMSESYDPSLISSGKLFGVMIDSHIRSIANANGLAYYENQIKNSNNNSDQ